MVHNIIRIDPTKLRPRLANARTHSKRQIGQIADSIRQFGFISPVLIDGQNCIIAGHGRVEAAKLLGLGDIPVVTVDHLSPEQIRAYVIADNKIAENAGWDKEILRLELKELADCSSIDLRVTGFETAEIDILIADCGSDRADSDTRAVPNISPVSKVGDIWKIGDHRLICGDATDPETYRRLMDGKRAHQVFTDPPYNVPISGHVSGLGKIKHPEFAMATGEMTHRQFSEFLERVMGLLSQSSQDGSLHYVCMDWRHLGETLQAGRAAYTEFKNLCVWKKTNAGMGAFYRSQHELILVFKNGTASHTNNIELGKHGRYRTNVWDYPGQTSFGSSRDEELAMHPTVKPIALVADAIADASHRGDIILDAFVGSGTTLLAAQKVGRRGFGIELSPQYVDLAIRRLEERFGLQANHADLNRTFDDVKRLRKKEHSNSTEISSRIRKAATRTPISKGTVGKPKRASKARTSS